MIHPPEVEVARNRATPSRNIPKYLFHTISPEMAVLWFFMLFSVRDLPAAGLFSQMNKRG